MPVHKAEITSTGVPRDGPGVAINIRRMGYQLERIRLGVRKPSSAPTSPITIVLTGAQETVSFLGGGEPSSVRSTKAISFSP